MRSGAMRNVTHETTLGQAFALGLLGLGLCLAGLLLFQSHATRRSVVQSATSLGAAKGETVGQEIENYLFRSEKIIDELEVAIAHGAIHIDGPLDLEAPLFAMLLANPQLMEISLTHAREAVTNEAEGVQLLEGGRWQVALFRRSADPKSQIDTRVTEQSGTSYRARVRTRVAGGLLEEAPLRPLGPAEDPTEHATFQTPAAKEFRGNQWQLVIVDAEGQ